MLGLVALLQLSALVASTPNAPRFGSRPPHFDCHLRHIATDLPADDDATGERGIFKCNAVRLCCPLSTPAQSDAGCVVLYGTDMATIHHAQSGDLIRVTPNLPTGAGSAPAGAAPARAAGATGGLRAAADVSSLPASTRASFGNLPAIDGTFQLDPHGARGRRLQTSSPGGALFVNRTAYHGSRTTLHVIVNALDPGNGDVRRWTLPCLGANVRKSFFGTNGGSNYATGASPYALRPECRAGANSTCKFNTRDHVRSISQNRVDLPTVGSTVVTVGTLLNYPASFCGFYVILNLVRDAVRKNKGIDPDAFQHMLMYLPKNCAMGQAEQPGKNVLVQLCPGGDRDNLYANIAHELGHNLGLGHGSIYQGSTYGDGSSFMASGGGGRINTLNLAHRHAFNWLPGLTGLYVSTATSGSVSALSLKLADVNTAAALPAGAVWGAKIDDADGSWFVGYRGCTGYDFTSQRTWCGGVQISRRFSDQTQAFHHAWLRAAGERISFGGSDNFTTVELGSVAAPLALEPAGLYGGLAITLSVKR